MAKKKPPEETTQKKGASKGNVANLRMWQPGQSGNPGGRPRVIAELRDIAREHTMTAIETLVKCCSNPDAPWAARVAAAGHILDRGYGRPAQHITGTIKHVRELSDAELLAFVTGADDAQDSGDGTVAPSLN